MSGVAVTTAELGLRERLVAATAAVIDEDGPLAVRVDEVARRAGCPGHRVPLRGRQG